MYKIWTQAGMLKLNKAIFTSEQHTKLANKSLKHNTERQKRKKRDLYFGNLPMTLLKILLQELVKGI